MARGLLHVAPTGALVITLGLESIVSLKDACGLGDDDPLAVLPRATVAMLPTALADQPAYETFWRGRR